MGDFDKPIDALELSVAGVLRLLGGDEADRQRYFEIVKGITTPREALLVNSILAATTTQFDVAKENLAALEKMAAKR